MLTRKSEVFSPTDGVLYVCQDLDARALRGSDFSDVALCSRLFPLDFRRMRISGRDVDLMEATGTEMTVKAEVRNVVSLTPEMDLCDTWGRIFELTRVEDRGRTCWLWLSEIKSDGTCTLIKSTTARDSHGIPTTTTTETVVYVRKAVLDTKRTVLDGIDMRPQVTLRLRRIDYDGETTLERNGVTYTVITTEGSGKWVDLTCERKATDR